MATPLDLSKAADLVTEYAADSGLDLRFFWSELGDDDPAFIAVWRGDPAVRSAMMAITADYVDLPLVTTGSWAAELQTRVMARCRSPEPASLHDHLRAPHVGVVRL